ncbi:hypothetical protein HDU89_005674 [Geranomyces variabilis]|nr:hypothetical protein HDU89_005674 [Geranomyces variabilis]
MSQAAPAAAQPPPPAAPPGDHDPQTEEDEEGAWVDGEDADPSEDLLTQEREVKQQAITHDEPELSAVHEEYTIPQRPKAGDKNAVPSRPTAPQRPQYNQNQWTGDNGHAGSKRQKTAQSYGAGGGGGGGRSAHAEEWDDTALIEGWDAAVLEYQMFHSDQPATGGNIKRKKRQAKPQPQSQPPTAESATASVLDSVAADEQKHAQHSANGSDSQTAPDRSSYGQCASCGVGTVHASTTPAFPGSIPGVEAPMGLDLPQDEDLANVMMSWYYAGLYSGIYQAKMRRQAEELKAERHKHS